MRAFISYSHKDAAALERLHTHLAMLKRDGKVTTWYDRDILAGGLFSQEIRRELVACELFLALVSPDFLASDYCYEREMQVALARHTAGEMRVVPIIIEPCDWKASPLASLKAIPKDGLAISEWPNQNKAYLDVVTELRRLTESKPKPAKATAEAPRVSAVRCSSTRARSIRRARLRSS